MPRFKPTKNQKKRAKHLVQHYIENRHLVLTFLDQILGYLSNSPELEPYIHTLISRLKDPGHLLDKIYRQMEAAVKARRRFAITPQNLFSKITDLAGVRILHLHTTQMKFIDPALRQIFSDQQLRLIEGPFARTWDIEYERFFQSLNITPEDSDTMYTSVHYIVESASRMPITCEIQVRTLAEEIWGEVNHNINYPHSIDSISCKEQIRTLARATSTVTRLVDSIFASVDDHRGRTKKVRRRKTQSRKRN